MITKPIIKIISCYLVLQKKYDYMHQIFEFFLKNKNNNKDLIIIFLL